MKLLRRAGLASFQATKPAVTPMAMSPYPAGQAKIAGRMLRTCKRTKMNPMIRGACRAVKVLEGKDSANWRNAGEVANHSEKRSGARVRL